tara:strand:- start:5546 stop:6142 length:597 start_codon:yes stop_codon:yes gene_type:complete
MAQVKSFTWTNAASAVARDQDVGFVVEEATTVDTTNGGSWYWNSQMADAAVLDVDSGTFTTSNGFTPLSQSSNYGATMSAMTNANPGVITCTNTAPAGFAAGDTIAVERVAESGTGTSLNRRTFTIASLTATTITLDQNTTSDAVYVSGGAVSRVSDTAGVAIAQENFAIRGVTVGTTPVGANSAVMVMVCKSSESVT